MALSIKKRKVKKLSKVAFWSEYILNFIYKSKVEIPTDIGQNYKIVGNTLVTNKGFTTLLSAIEYEDTISSNAYTQLIRDVKNLSSDGVKISVHVSSKKSKYLTSKKANREQYDNWVEILPALKNDNKAVDTARRIYAFEQMKSANYTVDFTTKVSLYAPTLDKLKSLQDITLMIANRLGITFLEVENDVQGNMLNYMPWMYSSKVNPARTQAFAQTDVEFAKGFGCTAMKEAAGVCLGLRAKSNVPYLADFKRSSNAKNIYVIAPSGQGKTFLVSTWLQDMSLDDSYRFFITDVKGNEFTSFINDMDGIIINAVKAGSHLNYFNFLSGSPEEDSSFFTKRLEKVYELLTLFFDDADSRYREDIISIVRSSVETYLLSNGVQREVKSSWKTLSFTGWYKHLKNSYLKDIKNTEENKIMYNTLKPFFEDLSLFSSELDIEKVKNSRAISISIGMITEDESTNKVGTRLANFLSAEICNLYIAHNKAQKLFTTIVNEEAQLVSERDLKRYAKDVSLRRSQNAITIIIANSIKTTDNPSMRIIIDSITMWVVGKVNREQVDYISNIQELQDKYVDVIKENSNDRLNLRNFTIIDKINKVVKVDTIYVNLPESIASTKRYKTVDVV